MSELLKKLPEVRGTYRENAQLKNWFNVGGPAEILFRPADLEDLQYFLKNRPKEIPLNILGAASNVIIKDEGVKGVVIRLGGEFGKISHQGENLIAGAAALCANVALYSKNAALSGVEFFSGIPGSIGGAVAMNAGCYGTEVADRLVKTTACDLDGNLFTLSAADCRFSYRRNDIAKNLIFIEAEFKLEKSSAEEVAKKIADCTKMREEAQPIRVKTGGSTFKNPAGKKAWQLIDEAGCRGLKIGGAQISEKHCNFMINCDNASAQDLLDLGAKVKQEVKKKSDIDLEWEIKVIG